MKTKLIEGREGLKMQDWKMRAN